MTCVVVPPVKSDTTDAVKVDVAPSTTIGSYGNGFALILYFSPNDSALTGTSLDSRLGIATAEMTVPQ